MVKLKYGWRRVRVYIVESSNNTELWGFKSMTDAFIFSLIYIYGIFR